MTTAQIVHMKAKRPELYALWCRLERYKWDSAWWRFCFTLHGYLTFQKRVMKACPEDMMYSFACMWWEIGMVAKYYPHYPINNSN